MGSRSILRPTFWGRTAGDTVSLKRISEPRAMFLNKFTNLKQNWPRKSAQNKRPLRLTISLRDTHSKRWAKCCGPYSLLPLRTLGACLGPARLQHVRWVQRENSQDRKGFSCKQPGQNLRGTSVVEPKRLSEAYLEIPTREESKHRMNIQGTQF